MLKKNLKRLNHYFPRHAAFPLPYIIPLYHSVSDEHLPHIQHIIKYKNTREFERDLDQISRYFDFVDWHHFKNSYTQKRKKPIALLTFDDGLIEFKEIVLPILKRKGIYAINFVNSAFVGNSDMMFRFKASLILAEFKKDNYKVSPAVQTLLKLTRDTKEEIITNILSISYSERDILDRLSLCAGVDFKEYQRRNKIYMDMPDLKYVTSEGFGIAAHSDDHPYYYQLSLEEQLRCTQNSLDFTQENQFINEAFAFPFTDFGVSKDFFVQLFRQNKNLELTFGISGAKVDEFERNLHRIPMESGFAASDEIAFEKNYYLLKKIFNKNTVRRL